MGDRLVYFKHLRLGDVCRGPEGREFPVKETEFLETGSSTVATPIQRGGGGTYKYIVKSLLFKNHGGAAETLRQFEARKLQLIKDIRTVAGFAPGTYAAQRGTLAVVEDSGDLTTTVNDEVPGSAVIIHITTDPGYVSGDYALLIQGTTYEVVHVNAVNASPPYVRVDTLVNSFTAGATIARLLYHVPFAYCQRTPQIPGHDPGTARASIDLEWLFESAEDPVWYLP